MCHDRRVVRDIKCLTEGAIKSQSRQVMASAVMAELADLLIASLECFKNSRANQSELHPTIEFIDSQCHASTSSH